MPGVRGVPLARDRLPVVRVERREERVRVFHRRVDVGEVHRRGQRQCERIHLRAADHAQLAGIIFFGGA